MSNDVRKTYSFPKEVHDLILSFKEAHDIGSESAAVRELVRRGIREQALFQLTVLYDSGTEKEEIAKEHPELVEAYRVSLNDHVSDFLSEIEGDLVELAGGIENLSKEEVEAIRKVTSDDLDHTFDELQLILSSVLPKVSDEGSGGLAVQGFANGVAEAVEQDSELQEIAKGADSE